jgi:structural maintenance of chromosome 2
MFNNANVIFRTKFVDGVSTVTRTIGTGTSARARTLAESDNREAAEAPARKRGTSSRGRKAGKENTGTGRTR